MKKIGITKFLIGIIITVKLVYGGTIIVSAFAFEYHWESDETSEGIESYTPVAPIHIELLGDLKQISHHSASLILKGKYNVYLDDDVEPAHASALLNTFSAVTDRYDTVSYWTVVDRHIHNDISIKIQGDIKEVEISLFAFQYANPLLAKVDGVQGKVFSKRLHRAVLRFISDDGFNTERINRILNERYGVNTQGHDYVELTKHTTGEHSGRFEPFKPEELIYLISILEEFPEGMRKTEGLKYIIRRKDGTFHPLYPDAPAVAWPHAGYIEFMEGAFKGRNIHYIYRLIAHEKSHFLWAYTFDNQLKQDWITLGEWKQDDKGKWYTEQDTQFVSAYAHDHSPDEDMAESISYYIINPDKLRTHASAKYEFIQRRVMHGNRYISIIREDLTFKVYNLWPDYVYANRIKSVDITVAGDPKEDKHVHIEIELHKISDANNMDAAIAVHGLLTAEDGLPRYMSFYPVDNNGNRVKSGYRLVNDFVFSKHVTHGYWSSSSLSIYDSASNARHISPNHFGWKLFIDNPLADNEPPVYIPNTVEMEVSKVINDKGEPYNLLHVKWKAYDNYAIAGVICTLNNKTDNNIYSLWVADGYWDENTGYAHTYKNVPEYFPSGEYEVAKIIMGDHVSRETWVYFSGPAPVIPNEGHERFAADEPAPSIYIETTMPDTDHPELDVNNIYVKATPTNPEAPNGETDVEISFRMRDNISGPHQAVFYIRDPHGNVFQHIFGKHHNGMYPDYDVTEWEQLNFTFLLPEGSAPGRWGITSCTVEDRAQNRTAYDFTEIVRFEVPDEQLPVDPDINQDGKVNILDLVIVANAFEEFDAKADLNGDGKINILDLVIVANSMN